MYGKFLKNFVIIYLFYKQITDFIHWQAKSLSDTARINEDADGITKALVLLGKAVHAYAVRFHRLIVDFKNGPCR